ncbi:hypothetical protein ABZ863_11695 [Saccharomonospora sp. NPDC046836]|uniref:hypothetical protein n=1 Tax=Saccharomonospora sp. NPDC046836 TaxID=3156921 RepID=UPI0033DA7707
MGTVYCGPYADKIGYDLHEGYAARILPDGTETGTWTYETREFVGHRAHCTCGWRGQHRYPATDHGENLAHEEWDHDHLRPMVDAEARRHTVPATVLLALARELRHSVTTTVNDRGEQVLTERGRSMHDAAQLLDQLLDELARGEQ